VNVDVHGLFVGATGEIRTHDLRITSYEKGFLQLFYTFHNLR